MTAKEGTLHLQASGRWAIMRPGREPFELTSGDIFRVEVGGKLQITCMEHLWGGYYSVDGYKLRDGMRAAIGVEALPRKKAKISDQGKLCRLPVGGWAIAAPGLEPVAIVAGEIFEIQVRGVWWRARMNANGTAEGERFARGQLRLFRGWPVPVELREGLRAGFFDGREKFANPLTE
jgi:Domain of unknown function (DUF5348)